VVKSFFSVLLVGNRKQAKRVVIIPIFLKYLDASALVKVGTFPGISDMTSAARRACSGGGKMSKNHKKLESH
jgi:hypothetical protein